MTYKRKKTINDKRRPSGLRHVPARAFRFMEEKCFERLEKGLRRLAMFDILDRLGKGVIVVSLTLYLSECGARKTSAQRAEEAAKHMGGRSPSPKTSTNSWRSFGGVSSASGGARCRVRAPR